MNRRGVREAQTIVRGSDPSARHHEIELGAESSGCLYSVSLKLQYLVGESTCGYAHLLLVIWDDLDSLPEHLKPLAGRYMLEAE